MSSQNEHCVVVRGFYLDQQVIENLHKIKSEIPEGYDFFFLYDETPRKVKKRKLPEGITAVPFNQQRWVEYKTPDKYHQTFIPGNEETMFLMFFDEYSLYKHYWFIEYDVHFSGNWRLFFDAFQDSDADLLSTTLVAYDEFPEWGIWKSLTPPSNVTVVNEHKVRGFFPFARFSNRALSLLKTTLSEGWSGHPEALVATVMLHHGLTIEDIGGDGQFVQPDNKNRFYTNNRFDEDLGPGTFKFRPKYRDVGDIPNMLWHPVKDEKLVMWDTKKTPMQKFIDRIFSKLKKWSKGH
ncbi:hypothetical protein ACFSJY_13835 [Thalassotalea euphylliae]|uniref:hypothetical protein n=1 Tax=Thalassotalea euphylliae TaxID=1655234 RepID=UPI00364537D9